MTRFILRLALALAAGTSLLSIAATLTVSNHARVAVERLGPINRSTVSYLRQGRESAHPSPVRDASSTIAANSARTAQIRFGRWYRCTISPDAVRCPTPGPPTLAVTALHVSSAS